ncbi:MAG: hypothetical protein EOQ89_03610 [Mesorhizobium sp.]|nr:MAG: hypothetical protein EOQ89_03610 [Mesorhizobium sp.]
MSHEQDSITLFLTEDGARRTALKVIGNLKAGSYRIIPGTLKCKDRSVDQGFKVEILKADLTRLYFL